MVRPPSKDPVSDPDVESIKVEAENSCNGYAATALTTKSKTSAYNVFIYINL